MHGQKCIKGDAKNEFKEQNTLEDSCTVADRLKK